MILLLGASGHVGQAFSAQLRRRGLSFIPLTRRAVDYSKFDLLFNYVRQIKPEFVINAAGFSPNPDVDACELAREEVLSANVLLPQTIARVCLMTNKPWGHVSSGCIYSGAKVVERGRMRIERNLNQPEMRERFARQPETIFGFNEWDEPNFSFRHAPCNFYCGTKALAEEEILGVGRSYIWRPGMLFNELDEDRNLLSRFRHGTRVHDDLNSMTHLDEFVSACLDLWERRAPFGIYNMVNPGAVSTRWIVAMMQQILNPPRPFEFWQPDGEADVAGTRTPRSNCILDAGKLLALGVKMRPVEQALEDTLERWNIANPSPKFAMAASS
jgi:UDP-glucose 4,6-dehydratase